MEEIKNDYLEEKIKKPKMIAVRVLSATPHVALVEWHEGELLRRAYVQTDSLQGDRVAESDLQAGAPASIPWEKLIKPKQVTGLDFAKALQKAEIITKEDLYLHFDRLMGVIAEVYGVELSSIVQAVEGYGK